MYIMLAVVNQTLVGQPSSDLPAATWLSRLSRQFLIINFTSIVAHNLGRECAKAQSGVHAKSWKEDMLILPS